MPVTIVSSAFADPFSNSVNYYRSNAGDKMLMRMRVKERIEVVSGATAYLSLNPIDNIITWTGGNLVVAVDENTAGWNCTQAWYSYTATAAAGPRSILYYNDATNPNPAAPPVANQRNSNAQRLSIV